MHTKRLFLPEGAQLELAELDAYSMLLLLYEIYLYVVYLFLDSGLFLLGWHFSSSLALRAVLCSFSRVINYCTTNAADAAIATRR